MAEVTRPELGSYMSAECFRYLRMYAEETAGRGLIVMAGKQRGLSLEDNLKGIDPSDDAAITKVLGDILGKNGTRLCIVDKVSQMANGYTVQVRESACSTGMKTAEPNCAFTMGVFLGAMEVIGKKRLSAVETECVATGHAHCVYKLEQI